MPARKSAAGANRHRLLEEIEDAASRGYSYYVYDLADEHGVFYVGKGKGKRVFLHGATTFDPNAEKIERIKACGTENVTRRVLAYFTDEIAAFKAEAALIAELPGLTNMAPGYVDPREAAQNRVKALLAQLVPFDECVGRNYAVSIPSMGITSARQAYDWLKASLERMAENPTPLGFHVISQPDGNRTMKPIWSRQ